MRHRIAVGLVVSLILAGVSWSTTAAEPRPPAPPDGPQVYTGQVDLNGLSAIVAVGVDRQELKLTPVPGDEGTLDVEVIMSANQADALADAGVVLKAKVATAQRRHASVASTVFRTYLGEGGIQEELAAQVAAHPLIAELEVIGQTVNGTDISAVRVTKNPSRVKDGKRPTTVYIAAQHAREWITPEMVRRLLDHVLAKYGSDPTITRLINTTEMWFIPVANPDGYDWTFEDGQRLWRKNLADNDGDGVISGFDGVDLNRNSSTRWGYDNEGSSPNPVSETYRGAAPASEPETQALDALFARITPEFFVNYHSAAELLLHGIGWQVATPSPDDVLYEAMVGDDAHPAVPGYDPDISAELYTTNGDIDSHMQEAYGTLGFTPEMQTCESASASNPNDQWEPEDCGSVFEFPDDEALVLAEFERNIPFALAVAGSADDPDDPISVVGLDTPDFVVDSFDVSYGDPQTVAVTAKRAMKGVQMRYRINGGRSRVAFVREWEGGERYGFENDDYYAELRGTVRGAKAGDRVEVWFTGELTGERGHPRHRRRITQSEHFTYTVAQDTGNNVLVIANEDYTGYNPEEAPSGAPKYIDTHLQALADAGYAADVWDVDAQGVPHDLGVLSHYDAVVWYIGDNRLTQDEQDVVTDTFAFGPLPDLSVAERQHYLTMAVRDFLNEGGKLIHAGETVGYYGLLGGPLGGIYYGLDGAPDQDCEVTSDFFSDCLLLADDFTQYYLGAYGRTPLTASGVRATTGPLAGGEAFFGGPATVDNPVDEAGAFTVTSDILPPDEFPQFASQAAAEYINPEGPFFAIEGDYAVFAGHADDSYMRVARTFDLTGIADTDVPTFEAQMSWDTEPGYDHVIVEAHIVGQDDWTTLPDLNGGTTTDVPTECEVGFLLAEHPNLLRYLTLGNPCTPTTPGAWNSLTGSSDGWTQMAFDLTAYAGQEVELVISYVTDPSSGGVGVIVDDTRLTTTGGLVEAEGFETGLGSWAVLDAPEGSPGNVVNFERGLGIGGITAAVTTADTVVLGFGLEQFEDPGARAAVIAASLAGFGL
jgi:murein tripeptide amidase MpaA